MSARLRHCRPSHRPGSTGWRGIGLWLALLALSFNLIFANLAAAQSGPDQAAAIQSLCHGGNPGSDGAAPANPAWQPCSMCLLQGLAHWLPTLASLPAHQPLKRDMDWEPPQVRAPLDPIIQTSGHARAPPADHGTFLSV